MSLPILNIASCRFTPLAELPALRQKRFDHFSVRGLRGTVLLAEEGINQCLAGGAGEAWRGRLRADARFVGLAVKPRWSTAPGWHGRCFVFDERAGLDTWLAA